ncbi:MAG: hypothetical protein ACFFG0_15285 [Candidatus Thorarchaeota archaeon]
MAQIDEKSPLIGIRWLDAMQMHDRIYKKDFKRYFGLSRNYNIGWIVDENPERVLLCHGYCSSGEFDILAIPTNAIVERVELCK